MPKASGHPHASTHLPAGTGRIHAKLLAGKGEGRVTLPVCAAAYPLKLVTTRAFEPRVACAYLLGYGGGMVDGDVTSVEISVGHDVVLALLTQGSTKVYRSRHRAITPPKEDGGAEEEILGSRATITARVGPRASLILLPAPVSPFREATFRQKQSIHLDPASTLVLLDWFSAGRPGHGDRWVFTAYASEISVYVGERLLLRDAQEIVPDRSPLLEPYTCYATVILWGTEVAGAIEQCRQDWGAEHIRGVKAPPFRLHSVSDTRDGLGVVIRCAAFHTDEVSRWLEKTLAGISTLCGKDVLARAFAG